MSNEPTWNEATTSGNYVKFIEEIPKTLVLTDVHLDRNPEDAMYSPGAVCMKAVVVMEDGEAVKDRVLDVSSTRLLKKLQPIFEGVPREKATKIQVTKVGKGFDTQYSVQVVDGNTGKP